MKSERRGFGQESNRCADTVKESVTFEQIINEIERVMKIRLREASV